MRILAAADVHGFVRVYHWLVGQARAHEVDAHIHGHIHQAFGRAGKHLNVASAAQKRAMMIELPSTRHTVITEN